MAIEYIMVLDGEKVLLDVEVPDIDIHLSIDASLMERAIRNLLDNALRYGKEGHFLGIRLTEDEHYVELSIIDKGKEIPVEHHAHIFNRFCRVDNGREGEGLGIDLSIVKEIVELCQGSIYHLKDCNCPSCKETASLTTPSAVQSLFL